MMIENNNKLITLTDNFILVVGKLFSDISEFDHTKIKFLNEKNEGYTLTVKYSVDKINFVDSAPLQGVEFYVVLFGDKNIRATPNNNLLYIDKNINNELFIFEFSSVEYDEENVEFGLTPIGDVIDLLPKWNYYDNMQQTINNWKRQLVAVSEMYGHQMSYFKTDPVKTDQTFQNNYVRDVVDIKKLLILVPNNNLPGDTVVYSEWDYAPVDEIYFDVVDANFKHAFGDDNIPMQGDAVFFPLINKYFRVTSVQPKNGFMGYIGWWNVYLTKYEEDESIGFSDGMQAAMSGTEFGNELEAMLDGGLISHESILENTIDEKKEVTENFTNKLVDSGDYVELKETENLREFISKRLEIVQLKPETEAFPVTMYNCNTVERRNIALVYDLSQYTQVNKLSTTPQSNFNLSLNIATDKFLGEIVDLLTLDDSIYFTLGFNRSMELLYTFAGDEKVVITTLNKHEYYQISITVTTEKIKIVIFKLNNGVRSVAFTNDITFETPKTITELTKINLYGGNYYVNDLTLNVDDKKIMQDYCNPIFKHR